MKHSPFPDMTNSALEMENATGFLKETEPAYPECLPHTFTLLCYFFMGSALFIIYGLSFVCMYVMFRLVFVLAVSVDFPVLSGPSVSFHLLL